MQISSVAFYTGNIHCHHENHSVIYYFKFDYAKESEICITVIWVFYWDSDEKVVVPVINEPQQRSLLYRTARTCQNETADYLN
jgi:hypothetical protein